MTTLFDGLIRERDRALAYVFGRDVFISYARMGKGRGYASGLANALKRLDKPLSVYFDQWAAPAGAELPPTLLLALRRASVLVVLATEEALQSPHVTREIETFAKFPRSIVSVDNGCLAKARDEKRCWPAVLNGVWVRESAFEDGVPAADVIRHIVDVVGDGTQQRRLQNVARWTAIGFGLVVLAAAVVTFGTSWLALKARQEADFQTQRSFAAAAATNKSDQLRKAAEVQKRTAEAQANAAQEKTKKAEALRRVAEGQRKSADEQKRIAQQLGHALMLANNASVILGKEGPNDLAGVARLAAEALKETDRLHIQSLQVNQVARNILDLMPVVHDPLKDHKVQHILGTTSDVTSVAILEDQQIVVVNLSTGRSVVLTETGDSARVDQVTFSGNGLRCTARVTGEGRSVIRVWDIESGTPVGPPVATSGPKYNFCLDYTGDHIGLWDAHTLTILNVTSGRPETAELKVDKIDEQFAFSPIEPLIVFSDGKKLLLWRWQSEREPSPIGSEEDTGYRFQFLFTRKGELAASIDQIRSFATIPTRSARLTLWSLSGGMHRKWRQERERTFGMVLSDDDSEIAAWDERSIIVYPVANGAQQRFIGMTGTTMVGVSGAYLAAANINDSIRVFDLENMGELDRVINKVWPSAIHINGNTITSVTPVGLQQWGDIESPITSLNTLIYQLAFLPDEDVLVVLTVYRTILMLNPNGNLVTSWIKTTGKETTIAAASGRRVLMGDLLGNVTIHTPFRTLPPLSQHDEGAVVALAVSRSSRYVAVATHENVYVWSDWASAHPDRIQLKDTRNVTALAFGASDDELVTGSGDGIVQRRNWRTGIADAPMKHGSSVDIVAVDRKGTTIASAGAERVVNLWNLTTGAKRQLPHEEVVNSAAFDPSGEYVATVSRDHFFRIWRVAGNEVPQVITRIQCERGDKTAFSASGNRVAYGGPLILTAWKTKDLIAALCQRVDCSKPAPEIH